MHTRTRIYDRIYMPQKSCENKNRNNEVSMLYPLSGTHIKSYTNFGSRLCCEIVLEYLFITNTNLLV